MASVCCALQVALLGAITPNIRSVRFKFTETHIDIFYFYDHPPSEDEEEMSEVVSTEVMCSFLNITVDVHRFVVPEPQRIPNKNEMIGVYSRYEKPPPEDN